ncbi:MAG: acyl transferase [Bacteroidota bacterium]|nr:acyl transferase [Bacteroidota bacterium]
MSSIDTDRSSLLDRIYNINASDFATVAMEVWRYQYFYNGLYRAYCHLMGRTSTNVSTPEEIPFLPIQLFKDHEVITGDWQTEKSFRSSGTTDSIRSQHIIRDLSWYHSIAENCFKEHLGAPADYHWIGLLPSYLERDDSSLIEMVRYFIELNPDHEGSFYPAINSDLLHVLRQNYTSKKKTILIGVSFALLELFASRIIPIWDELIVIETGGMKGRGPEITRDELHQKLKTNHPALRIVSEYGMTELLSQAYMITDHFRPGPTMKIFIRDISDPLSILPFGQRGAVNIIDLANLDSCTYIATDDVGRVYEDGSFDILGRIDQSDLRGCNLLYT